MDLSYLSIRSVLNHSEECPVVCFVMHTWLVSLRQLEHFFVFFFYLDIKVNGPEWLFT